MPDTKAIKKIKTMIDGGASVASLAKKLGVARGTLLGLIAGTTSPRLDVVIAAEKLGIKQKEWT